MWPQFNKVKDKIFLIAPSNGKNKHHLLKENIKVFQKMGYLIEKEDFNFFDQDNFFHSNSNDFRFDCLKEAIENPDAKIIWSVAGGYGAAKLIDKLKNLPCPQNEKIFIGFSDNTALHLFFNKYWNWQTIHGSCFINKQKLDNIKSILDLIDSKILPESIILTLLNSKIINGQISGYLIGGNLALIQNSIGTIWEIDSKDKIIFLEDVNEPGYKIDRMLLHLEQANVFKDAKAIIFGDFTFNEKNNNGFENKFIEYSLNDFAQRIDIPVFKTDMFGHGENNIPLVIGSHGVIKLINNSYDFSYELE